MMLHLSYCVVVEYNPYLTGVLSILDYTLFSMQIGEIQLFGKMYEWSNFNAH